MKRSHIALGVGGVVLLAGGVLVYLRGRKTAAVVMLKSPSAATTFVAGVKSLWPARTKPDELVKEETPSDTGRAPEEATIGYRDTFPDSIALAKAGIY